MNLCVIPARGGSKRIPRKNIKEFCGKPMIAWPIEAAINSGCFERVVVSTDDVEIAEISETYGADVPFMRPTELADDYTVTRAVVNHAIREVGRISSTPDQVCVIYPTAPFIQIQDIQQGLKLLTESDADFAFSVTSYVYPIQRALKIVNTGGVEMFYPGHRLTRSQDLEPAYHDAGQFYWGKAEAFLQCRNTFSSASAPVILPNWRVVDIDNQEDWDRAELLGRAIGLRLQQ
jgi:pseudaminic acid cytidylyltransferase